MTAGHLAVPGQVGVPADVTTLQGLLAAGVQIGGLALLAGVFAALLAFGYRWYVREGVPDGVAILVGASAVAVVLNVQSALQGVIQGDTPLLDPATASFTVVAIVAGSVLADLGRRFGDRAGQRTARAAAIRDLGEMGTIVRSRGKSLVVELPAEPDDVGDVEGYDPVAPELKADLAGATFRFPRGLTVAELRDRLVDRLQSDYGVGQVDVEVDPDGTVAYLALGSRPAGIGTTLGPGTAAVAVRADPPFGASPGDTVQVWRGGEAPERITTAEFRGAAGDVVTLALDETEARRLDHDTSYRLVTLPRSPSAEREFASLLRAADETMGAVTVAEGSPLVGTPLGALDVTVAAVRTAEGIVAIPQRSRRILAGDEVYVVARPEALRRFESGAGKGTGSEGPQKRATPDESTG